MNSVKFFSLSRGDCPSSTLILAGGDLLRYVLLMSMSFLPCFSNWRKDPSRCYNVLLEDMPLECFDLLRVSAKLKLWPDV